MIGAQLAPPVRGQSTSVDDGGTIFLPIVLNGTDTPDPDPDREWDPRLDQRGAVLIEATVTPGEGYWRLIKARWYNTEESAGRHHIFADLLDEDGERRVGAPVLIT